MRVPFLRVNLKTVILLDITVIFFVDCRQIVVNISQRAHDIAIKRFYERVSGNSIIKGIRISMKIAGKSHDITFLLIFFIFVLPCNYEGIF